MAVLHNLSADRATILVFIEALNHLGDLAILLAQEVRVRLAEVYAPGAGLSNHHSPRKDTRLAIIVENQIPRYNIDRRET